MPPSSKGRLKLSIDFLGGEKRLFQLIKIKIVSFFSVDHHNIFDHKYSNDPDSLIK